MKNTTYLACLIALLLGAGRIAAAEEAHTEKVVLDMPEQPLEGALAQLALQADIKLVYYTALGAGLRAPAVVGSFTTAEALKRILGSTGLHAEYLDARTVVIRGEEKAEARARP